MMEILQKILDLWPTIDLLQYYVYTHPYFVAVLSTIFGEVGMYLAGTFAAQGLINVYFLIGVIFVHEVIYDISMFQMVRHFSTKENFFQRFLNRNKNVVHVRTFFHRLERDHPFGPIIAAALIKLIPGGRIFLLMYPVMFKISFKKFFFLDTCVLFVWANGVVLAGYFAKKFSLQFDFGSYHIGSIVTFSLIAVFFIAPILLMKKVKYENSKHSQK